jgi:hypothetical protein
MNIRILTWRGMALWCLIGIMGGLLNERAATALTATTRPDETTAPEQSPASALPDFLQFKINYIYRVGGKGEFQLLTNESILSSGDHYKIIFTPSQACYVYIFQVDSSHKIYSLFPMESFGGVTVNNLNPAQAGTTYFLPAEKKSFVLDQQTGVEKIYFLASQQRDLELEAQYQQVFEAQQQQNLETQLQQIDHLLESAIEARGVARLVESPKETTQATWQEGNETFSVLQQRLENLCNGCVHILTFTHQ